METVTKIIIFFVIISFVGLIMADVVLQIKNNNAQDRGTLLCRQWTEQVKENITENNTFSDAYCYYAPYYLPPEELKNSTQVLCICDYKVRATGEVRSIPLLGTTVASSPDLHVKK